MSDGRIAGGPDPAELAESVLDIARAVAGSDAEAEAYVRVRDEGLTRFANSTIHQNMASRASWLRLRVALDGRWAAASTNRVNADGLRRLVESTVEAARVRPVDPAYPGLAPASPGLSAGNWDGVTAAAGPDDRATEVAAFVAAVGGLEAAGYCATASVRGAYASTTGQAVTGRCTAAEIEGIARTTESDGLGRAAAPRLGDLAGSALGSVAAEKARAGADPVELPPGTYEVVLEPACVRNILAFLGTYGFNAKAVEEGRSFVEMGTTQFDPALSIWDDGTDELATGLPYDREGTPKRRVDLVTAGVSAALLHDRRTARPLGAQSTGHAVEFGEQVGPRATELRLGPGSGGGVAQLVSAVDRGLLVTDFWYTRILDPRTQVVTGLTRNGVWLVEGGRMTRPVRNLRFTQSYVDALATGAVRGVGSEPLLGPEHMAFGDLGDGGCFAAPALHLAEWHFTGGASG